MNILAIDTATSILSIALGMEQDIWYFEVDAGLRHSELVMDSVDLLMRKAGLAPADISGLLCMGGPGSFTGLRIGFSIAKGLALSLNIPFVPVPTLDCMAWPYSMWPGIIIPVIDAKKNAFFCALYRDGKRLGPPMDANPPVIAAAVQAITGLSRDSTFTPILLTGPDAAALYRHFQETPQADLGEGTFRLAPEKRRAYARVLLDIAKETNILQNNIIDYFSGPEYIRKSDAELRAAD